MLCIHNTHTDAWFNLAAEEYLLKNFSEDIFMLWQNEPAVVIGKYQNIRAETDIEYARQNESGWHAVIPVAVPFITIWET